MAHSSRIPGHATPEGTKRYRDRLVERGAASGHFRLHDDLLLSRIGVGTYLGEADEETDAASGEALRACLLGGINVVDTAANYRCQRSERVIGEVLAESGCGGLPARDEIFVTTKGGFLPFDGGVPTNPRAYLEQRFLRSGLVSPRDIVGGMHCMTPAYLRDQIRQSLDNLGLETVDGYFIHNPETQLEAIHREEFEDRLRAAFGLLEEEARAGRIRVYGVATWNGLRAGRGARDWLDLARLWEIAGEVAGADHRFRIIQLPYNLAMPEALLGKNQGREAPGRSTLGLARDLGLLVMTSAGLLQGRLASGLPDALHQTLPGLGSDAERALQFASSSPGVTVALVGMKEQGHVQTNLGIVRSEPLTETELGRIL